MKIDISKYDSLQEFADDFSESKEILKSFLDLNFKLRFDRLHCAVCDKFLSEDEKQQHTIYHFNFACEEHKGARESYQADIWAKRNGVSYKTKERFWIK